MLIKKIINEKKKINGGEKKDKKKTFRFFL